MMVLYSGTTCPYSHRCRFVLFEKGMDFEIRDVDLFAKPEDIALMNPYNEVPILVERDPHDPKKTEHRFEGYEQLTPGTLSTLEFDESVGDLVAFLQWMGEPSQGRRVQIGVAVLMFLAVFFVFAWRLNAAFWKDVK